MSTTEPNTDSIGAEPDDMLQQRELLAVYRGTLAHLLWQAANYGGVSFAPPETANGITAAGSEIQRIKTVLRENNVVVEDEPNDAIYLQSLLPRLAIANQVDAGSRLAIIANTSLRYYQPSSTPLDPHQQRNKRAMITKVKHIWIEGLLEQSLAKELHITLNLATKPDAVRHLLNALVQELNHPPRSLPPEMPIMHVFEQMGGMLLILGAPGAGKTMLLLELARDLILRAEEDEAHPIPVVFNLSSWAIKRLPLDRWLVEELNTKYDVPRKLAQAWIEADTVLPLLDGLDEVAAEHRATCVEVINIYRQEHGLLPLAICSRTTDYDPLTTKLQNGGAVVVQPLTMQQIDAFLLGTDPQLAALRVALTQDTALRELAETPLMLSIMALSYRTIPIEQLALDGSVSNRRTQLFNAYVEGMLMRRGAFKRYKQVQTLHWLAGLAHKMTQQAQSIFLIERMQPEMVVSSAHRKLYHMGEGLGWGLLSGLTAGLANELVIVLDAILQWNFGADQVKMLGYGFMAGLVGTFVGGLVGAPLGAFGSHETEIQHGFTRQLWWSIQRPLCIGLTVGLAVGISRGLAVEWIAGPPWGLVRGLSWGVSWGLSLGIIYGLAVKTSKIEIVETFRWSWAAAKSSLVRRLPWAAGSGLVLGLTVGFIDVLTWGWESPWLSDGLVLWAAAGLAAVCILALISGLTIGEIETRTTPNQGIRRSARNALQIGIAMWLVGALILVPMIGVAWGVNFGVAVGLGGAMDIILIGGLLYGGLACLRHIILRLLLLYSGALPLNLVAFLDYCAERIFLRKVGGGYIFVHRLLMEYFAGLDTSQAEKP